MADGGVVTQHSARRPPGVTRHLELGARVRGSPRPTAPVVVLCEVTEIGPVPSSAIRYRLLMCRYVYYRAFQNPDRYALVYSVHDRTKENRVTTR